MKLTRIILSIVGLLVLVVALAIGSLLYFIDPNKLKPILAEEVKRQTGYQLLMDGSISWSFFPHFGVKIPRMTLTAPKETTSFIDLHDVRLAMQLDQLLHYRAKLRGDIYISEVRLTDLHAQNAHINWQWRNNVLTMQPITASFYQGKLTASAHGRELAVVPHWDWDIALHDVQVKSLLQDVNHTDSKLQVSGLAQMTMQATTEGSSKEQILRHLKGKVELGMTNGSIDGVDLNYLAKTADALLNKQAVTPPTNFNQTVFSDLTGSIFINDGVATTNNLALTSPAFVTKGIGSVNLLSQALHIELQVSSKQVLTQWDIPVLVTGNLKNPTIRLNVTEVQKLAVKQELEKVKLKASEEIQKHIPGKAGELLQKLLN